MTNKWSDTVKWGEIPLYMREGIVRYIERGVPNGHFLTAIFSNDLMEAARRADNDNFPLIPIYAMFLYNECPIGSHGSPNAVNRWMKHRGLEGVT